MSVVSFAEELSVERRVCLQVLRSTDRILFLKYADISDFNHGPRNAQVMFRV